MSRPVKGFPDISNKLQAPVKKSAFERQKAEAEAKRIRDEAENAAALDEFVKSFEADEEEEESPLFKAEGRPNGVDFPPRGGFGGGSGPPKRHFAGSMKKSGPGSLGPAPSLPRKRAFDGSYPPSRDKEQGIFAYENSSSDRGHVDAATEFQEDEEEERGELSTAKEEVPRPTVRLSNLPPQTSALFIKSLFPGNLKVTNVHYPTSSAPGPAERKSTTAIAILEKGTPASEIDAAVNALQKKYMGRGYYLDISRHLSTASLGAPMPVSNVRDSGASALPFGARHAPTGPGPTLNRAPPPGPMRGNFAPPASYGASGYGQPGRSAPAMQVPVQALSDLKQLKLIHKTIENVIEHGAEFEALLMSRPEVIKDEKWAWIWDPRSPGGIYYRWRIWELLSGAHRGRYSRKEKDEPPRLIFDGSAPWTAPKNGLLYEYSTNVDDFASDPDYNSSEDDDSDNEGGRKFNRTGAPIPEGGVADESNERSFLNPMEKARLTWLLAGLPTTTAKLRKGDTAAVMDFAISHANRGIDEVVDMLITNIERPLAWCSANPDRQKDSIEQQDAGSEQDEKDKLEKDDPSSSKLVALYLISDVLHASSYAGVTGAWRYRQLFEAALQKRKVFSQLGRLDRDLQWGRLKAEKWKRAVNNVLSLWETWSTFDKESHKHFVEAFANPPLTAAEQEAEDKKAAEEAEAKKVQAKTKKLAAIKEKLKKAKEAKKSSSDAQVPQSDGAGDEPAVSDVDMDGKNDEGLDYGEPMDVDSANQKVKDENTLAESNSEAQALPGETPAARARRLRPKAEDMFADSDDD